MGADCIISGIRPQIAQTIVHLGVDLANVITKATLADAFLLALARLGASIQRTAPRALTSGRSGERIPILKMGEFLLVTIQVDMHDRLAMTLQDDLTEAIVSERARGVLIDISALEVVDSFIGRMLGNIAAMARVLDAETVVVGHAAGGRDHARGARPVADRRAHGAQRREGHGPAQADRSPWRGDAMATSVRDETVADPLRRGRRARAPGGARSGRSTLGFSLVDQTKIVTAASELARNTLDPRRRRHGATRDARRGRPPRAAADVRGQGPGHRRHRAGADRTAIPPAAGSGLGLGGAKRLVPTSSTIESAPGRGHARHDHALEVMSMRDPLVVAIDDREPGRRGAPARADAWRGAGLRRDARGKGGPRRDRARRPTS